ncbi:MAG: 2,3-bisphosphoglycerate-independent phosphoglycerate mutase [Alphaproteobacteria bacterium]|nr:2,3-bisphosphoglycerate-independent phosphoglycerate mutase [Alphaproteobacteria bacterium]
MKKPFVLCILDGWGYNPETAGNAIELGKSPNWHRMLATYPHNLLEASGRAVGLPTGQMGNSEVGHTNIGAGRVVMQLLGEIEQAIENNTLTSNKYFIEFVKKTSGDFHLWGLLSDGGVHSHIDHIIALAKALATTGKTVNIHAVADGRDVPPSSAKVYVKQLLDALGDIPNIKLATLSGRYYAMDRDNNWDRVKLAYDALIEAKGPRFTDIYAAIDKSYAADTTDYFIVPTIAEGYVGANDVDGLLLANFRNDRVRQIAEAFAYPDFKGFARDKVVKFGALLGMAEYSEELNAFYGAMFPPPVLKNVLSEVLANAGMTQLHIAETEKYAHLTFFFNGGREEPFKGEDRILIPSAKVVSYDLKPEMSAFEITDAVEKAIADGKYDVIIINYANGDLVGHTGSLEAAEKAVVAVDACIGRLETAVLKADGIMLLTADHGNAEEMIDANGEPKTAHTTNPVECILIGKPDIKAINPGALCNIAPTLLKLMGIKQPSEMTCDPLF